MDFYLTASPSPFPCIEISWLVHKKILVSLFVYRKKAKRSKARNRLSRVRNRLSRVRNRLSRVRKQKFHQGINTLTSIGLITTLSSDLTVRSMSLKHFAFLYSYVFIESRLLKQIPVVVFMNVYNSN